MTFSQKERERLGALLLSVGPDAPTLNDGWLTRDLAAHLFIRERKTWKAGGMFVSALEGILDAEMEKQKARPYDEVVREWAGGPPVWVKPFDSKINTAEHFIHHEDVRRGGGEINPREFSQRVNGELLRWVERFGKMALKGSPVPVILTPPNLPPVTVGDSAGVAERGDDVVRVTGEPGELLLWVSGRTDATKVDFSGAVEKFTDFEIKGI